MKMLTTQLTGLLQRIVNSEEENIEETARLLAQAAAREGFIYFAAFGEMESRLLHMNQFGLLGLVKLLLLMMQMTYAKQFVKRCLIASVKRWQVAYVFNTVEV